MPYSIEVLSDPPVAIVTFDGKIDFEKDVDTIFTWVVEHQYKLVDVIHDVTNLQINFSDFVVAAGTAFKPHPDRPLPELDVVVVGLSGILKGAANWLAAPQYGNRRVRVYETREEALQGIKQKITAASL